MTDTRKDLPPVNSPNFLEKVRETLSVYLGNRGDKLNRGLTVRDLADAGIVELNPAWVAGGGTASVVNGPGSAIFGAVETAVDLTPPPTPYWFTASAGIANLMIESAAPNYTQGHGHSKAKLYGATWISGDLPVFANAVVISEFNGNVASYATNPATTWHLWLTWVTVDGVESAVPAGGTNGVVATTGQDVGGLLTALSGQLKQDQLHNDLGSRIALIDGPSSLANSVASRIDIETNARVAATDALAQQITTVQASLGDQVAAVQTSATATATAVTGLSSQYTVKVQAGTNYVTGFGLASTLKDGVPTSEFAVRADNFSIAPVQTDNTANDGSPFFYRTTSTTINGVVIPAGAYIKAAYIHDASITNAKIANATIDDAKIANLSAAKLTAGSIAVGAYIQSSNFVSGSGGWRIHGNGTPEFNNAIVRGTVYASSGSFTGAISASSFRTGSFTGYAWPSGSGVGSYLDGNGMLFGNPSTGQFLQVTAGGLVNAPGLYIAGGNASFSGSLVAATGTFAGSLTASAVNAVNTINLAGNSVTVPVADITYPGTVGPGGYSHTIYVNMPQAGKLFASGTIAHAYSGGGVPAWHLQLVINGVSVYFTGTVTSAFQQSATASGGLNVPAGNIPVTLSWAASSSTQTLATSSLYAVGAMR